MIHLTLVNRNLSKDKEKLGKSVSVKPKYSNWSGKDYNLIDVYQKGTSSF